MKRNFKYYNENVDFLPEVREIRQEAEKLIDENKRNDGRTLAETAFEIVERYLETKTFPDGCNDIEDLTMMAGTLFGEALRSSYGWKWAELGEHENAVMISVVSPKLYYCNQPFSFVRKIINGVNYDLGGENDNTILLLYNGFKEIENEQPDRLFTIIN